VKFQKASFWRRAFAFYIDGLLFAVPSAILKVFFDVVELQLLFEYLPYLYFVLMEANFQKTIGKQLMGLKVIKQNGRKPTLSDCFWRNAGRIVSLMYYLTGGYVRILAPHRYQTVHDEFARCYVVNADKKVDISCR
jgi:uncharacterized RDD family membrane protein YckC